MTKNIELFLNKLRENEQLAQKVAEAKSMEEVQVLAKDAGIEITIAELKELKNSKKLTEDDLDNVSGGSLNHTPTFNLIDIS
ncbi:MAG: Nif11-like leader peptide family natural product precursor [Firmicutes bacterium]|nr:Nif11-like leader peptide family natural product precursor [Bacillota bacterium]